MKKTITILVTVFAIGGLAFSPVGFPDLQPDTNPAKSFASQFGNQVSCTTNILLLAAPISSGSFVTGFYLSTDTSITTNDILIGTYTVYIPPSAQAYTCTVSNVDLTTKSVPSGTYYIGTFADIHNTISENGFTPELDNNGWAFRNGAGVYKIINYPALDVGIKEKTEQPSFFNYSIQSQNIYISSLNMNAIDVKLFDISGKLLEKTNGVSNVFHVNEGIYFIEIKQNGQLIRKKIFVAKD